MQKNNFATMISALEIVQNRAASLQNFQQSEKEWKILHMIQIIASEREKSFGIDDSNCDLADYLMEEIRAEACKRLNFKNEKTT
jgi:hypothetical protein